MLVAGLAIPFIFGASLTTGTRAAPNPIGGANAGPRASVASGDAAAGATGAATPTGTGGVAGPADGGSATGSGALASGTSAVDGLTASDRGVTATTITIAFLLAD